MEYPTHTTDATPPRAKGTEKVLAMEAVILDGLVISTDHTSVESLARTP